MDERPDHGDVTGWFDDLYRTAGGDPRRVPWARLEPHPAVSWWLGWTSMRGRAVVVGSGLGDDAEALAAAGFDTTAFDVSASAIDWAKRRFPASVVDYRVDDLLDTPEVEPADAVIEVRTIQSLPLTSRGDAIAAVVDLVAPGGELLVAALWRPDEVSDPPGPPWAVCDAELGAIALERVVWRRVGAERWAVYRRPEA